MTPLPQHVFKGHLPRSAIPTGGGAGPGPQFR